MKALLFLFLFLFLVSCSITSNKEFHLNEGIYDEYNSAIVVFRTVNELENRTKGFAVRFTNVETGEVITNSPGISGYPKETLYAFRFPPGEYELTNVFFYDGSMQPQNNAYRVSVKAGEITYIGTIIKSWSYPSNVKRFGVRRYERPYVRKEICFVVTTCDVDGVVFIYEEDNIDKEISIKFPEIAVEKMIARLLK